MMPLISYAVTDEHYSDYDRLHGEFEKLQKRVNFIEFRLSRLEKNEVSPVKQNWLCSLDDPQAGRLHSKGATEQAAKNRILEVCKKHEGTCWTHRISCSQDK